MHEAFSAVVRGFASSWALSPSEHIWTASALRGRGLPAILDVVFGMTAGPNKAEMSGTFIRRAKLVAELETMQMD